MFVSTLVAALLTLWGGGGDWNEFLGLGGLTTQTMALLTLHANEDARR
jgi:hypothetical protein